MRIQSLQEQVERHSMLSSMTPDQFDDEDEEEEYGKISYFTLQSSYLSQSGKRLI